MTDNYYYNYYSISVARVDISKIKAPESVSFGLGDFIPVSESKDVKTTDIQDKLDFLYTALLDKYYEKSPRIFSAYLKYIAKELKEFGVKEVSFLNPGETYDKTKSIWWWEKEKDNNDVGYSIDTDNMEDEFFKELIYGNSRRLISFLFSNKSVLNIQEDHVPFSRTDIGPEKNTEKVFYGWTWFC